jgi:hypothetical protein
MQQQLEPLRSEKLSTDEKALHEADPAPAALAAALPTRRQGRRS